MITLAPCSMLSSEPVRSPRTVESLRSADVADVAVAPAHARRPRRGPPGRLRPSGMPRSLLVGTATSRGRRTSSRHFPR